jgi:hypothetical protein
LREETMGKITIEFQGICTHLVPINTSCHPDKFTLRTGDKIKHEVRHRVVLANPDLVPTHIDPARHVPAHIPKLIVTCGIGNELAKVMVCCGGRYEMLLRDLVIGFHGVEGYEDDHWKNLQTVPHITEKDKQDHLRLRPLIKCGWSKFASAYIDFTTGVTFMHEKDGTTRDVVIATVEFKPRVQPNLVFRPHNGDMTKEYPIANGAYLIISNLPPAYCGDSDYLLNYFVTTLDITESAPVWPDPKPRPQPLGPEVYCSSTGYP